MQLGKTLVGAIIGGAAGIAVLVVFFLVFRLDQAWLAIVVAALTGLGVRMMVSTHGHASYLRGAITAVLALAIYLVGQFVMAKVLNAGLTIGGPAEIAKAAKTDAAEDADDEANTDGEADEAKPAPPPVTPTRTLPDAAMRRAPKGGEYPIVDIICLCVAALVAYNLGRGSGTAAAPGAEEESAPSERAPAGTHPDA